MNSNDWLTYSDNKKANVSLHARLRTIDRFALDSIENIEELYTEETKAKLQNLFNTIYNTSPVDLKGSKTDERIIADFEHNSNIIEAIFTNKGDMITIIPKKKN